MPEYLAPGVYVEEVSFRSKSIEGVSTSVAGFIGPTRYGPVGGEPELLTSFADFSRIYGGIDNLQLQDQGDLVEQPNYMAHAVRAFFDNGGRRLYVTRVYDPIGDDAMAGRASVPIPGTEVVLRARFPGREGQMRVTFVPQIDPVRPESLREFDTVYVRTPNPASPLDGAIGGLYDVTLIGGQPALTGGEPLLSPLAAPTSPILLADLADQMGPGGLRLLRLQIGVRVLRSGLFADEEPWDNLSPNARGRNALLDVFTQNPTTRLRALTIPFAIEVPEDGLTGAALAEALLGPTVLNDLDVSLGPPSPAARQAATRLAQTYVLRQATGVAGSTDGSDGQLPIPSAYEGQEPDDADDVKTGLKTFEDIDEISIVAAPGMTAGFRDNPNRAEQIAQHLITHCQIRMRYRVAVLDSPDQQIVSEVRAYRQQFDSTHAALYYPWVTIVDPTDPDGRRELNLPPSGFVAGIYARTDVLHGVFKAPANEVALGAVGFETLLNTAQQDVLNPIGVNCFRFFPGRGYRLWGARTISSDPEWKYVNVRRYFAYLEHSIDKGTQWAVFENNNESLWVNVTQTISDFLFTEWRNGALMGTKPEEAFFVRCDRSTMTQNDLDNGRLVCLIGVAVVKPAEFVIFRIGQFTADRRT